MRGLESLERRIALAGSTAWLAVQTNSEPLTFTAPNAKAAKGLAVAAIHANPKANRSPIFGPSGTTPTPGLPPVITAITIAPDDASDVLLLGANPSATSPSGGTVTYEYQWLQNGAPISDATLAVLNLQSVSVSSGDTFAVTVTPTA